MAKTPNGRITLESIPKEFIEAVANSETLLIENVSSENTVVLWTASGQHEAKGMSISVTRQTFWQLYFELPKIQPLQMFMLRADIIRFNLVPSTN